MANVAPWAFAIGAIAVFLIAAWRKTQQQIANTLQRRFNPTRDEFLALMTPDVSRPTAEFLWETAISYLKPKLTPHPDDDLTKDLPIDEDDWSMDWPLEFAERFGIKDKDLPDWPSEWPATLRNYGRWLDLGLAPASAD